MGQRPKASRGAVFTQLTFDSGLTRSGAVRDRKLLVYASDRAGESNRDIWVQQVSGGQPVQITHDPVDDQIRTFARRLEDVFRSERQPSAFTYFPRWATSG